MDGPSAEEDVAPALGAGTEDVGALRRAVGAVLQGKQDVVDLALTAILAGGHLLLQDVPGVGKTTLAHALAAAVGGSFRRVQFTADLLPADLTGVHLVEPGAARFVEEAPLFALARGRDAAACDAWATAALVSDALPPAGGDPTVWIVRSMGSRTLEVPGTDPPEPQTTR